MHGRPTLAPPTPEREVRGATRCETPRQACPRPSGFGRNLRSKTRWFTGFCNSHQVSHFAAFFIDARAEISVAESRLVRSCIGPLSPSSAPKRHAAEERRSRVRLSLAHPAPDSMFQAGPGAGDSPRARAPAGVGRGARSSASPRMQGRVRGSSCSAGFDNDPSAGSPTETLLRLLLPLNDKVQRTSRDVAGGGPPTSPRSEHFTGPFNR